jgi:hypothetical protein
MMVTPVLYQRQCRQIGIFVDYSQQVVLVNRCVRIIRQLYNGDILSFPLQRNTQREPAITAMAVVEPRFAIVVTINKLGKKIVQCLPGQAFFIKYTRRQIIGMGGILSDQRNLLLLIEQVQRTAISAQQLTAELYHVLGQGCITEVSQEPAGNTQRRVLRCSSTVRRYLLLFLYIRPDFHSAAPFDY